MKKWQSVVIIVSVALNVAVIATFGYLWAADHVKKSPFSEKELEEMKKKYSSVIVNLDAPDLDPQAIQFAYFDFDPIPAVKERAKSYCRIYNDMIKRYKTDEAQERFRKMYTRYMWDDAFKDINGDGVQILTKNGAGFGSNVADRKLWVVTKIREMNDELLCWCIPVMPEIGKEITVTLSKATAYDVNREFNDALVEASKKTVTQYPIDPNFKDEPSAHAQYNKMNEVLQSANSIYFESVIWNGREGEIHNKAAYRVWMKKPDLGRIEASKDGKVTGTVVYDGKYFWVYWRGKQTPFDIENLELYGIKKYMQIPSNKGEHRAFTRIGQLLQANIPGIAYETDRFYGGLDILDAILDGVRSVGTETVNGEVCDIIEVSTMKNMATYFYWISRNDHLPRKIRRVIHSNETYILNEVWSNLYVNVTIPAALFQWKPPSDWTQNIEPAWEENLLKPGTNAPDFELKSTDGKNIKLSNFKGKVVLLYFWSADCPVCRDVLPILERIYQRYKDKGFILIGIDNDDDYKNASSFLSENSISYPNIIDASPPAQDIQCKQYQTMAGRRASPMSYLIDRDGKVAEAWYGSDKENDEKDIIQKLKKLGIK